MINKDDMNDLAYLLSLFKPAAEIDSIDRGEPQN